MPKGSHRKSKIYTHNLDGVIRELRAKGYSYKQISEFILTHNNIKIQPAELTRFFKKEREGIGDFRHTKGLSSSLGEVQKITIDKATELLNETDRIFIELKKEIDELNFNGQLKNQCRSYLKGRLDEHYRELRRLYLDSKALTIPLFYEFADQERALMGFIQDMSRAFCPDCQHHVSKTIQDYQDTRKEEVGDRIRKVK
jgi:hypothetical protein